MRPLERCPSSTELSYSKMAEKRQVPATPIVRLIKVYAVLVPARHLTVSKLSISRTPLLALVCILETVDCITKFYVTITCFVGMSNHHFIIWTTAELISRCHMAGESSYD